MALWLVAISEGRSLWRTTSRSVNKLRGTKCHRTKRPVARTGIAGTANEGVHWSLWPAVFVRSVDNPGRNCLDLDTPVIVKRRRPGMNADFRRAKFDDNFGVHVYTKWSRRFASQGILGWFLSSCASRRTGLWARRSKYTTMRPPSSISTAPDVSTNLRYKAFGLL